MMIGLHHQAPPLDPLEFCRGVVSALTYSSSGVQNEVHTSRILAQFEHIGIGSECDQSLRQVRALREIESVGHGYWIPTSTRVVALNSDQFMLISIHPTSELKRHFRTAHRVGTARVIGTCDAKDLPVQLLGAWGDSDGLSAKEWTKVTIDNSINQFLPSIYPDHADSFGIATGNKNSLLPLPIWGKGVCTWRGVSLIRHQLGAKFRYFLGRIDGDSAFFEGPAAPDAFRLQYGLAALSDKKLAVRVKKNKNSISMIFPLPVPKTLYRLLIALGESLPETARGWKLINPDHWPIFSSAISDLNCEISFYE
jgi:hypothetical protein